MNYYDQIKELLVNNLVYKKVKDYSKNRSDLNTYYNVGKMLSDAGKHYGEGIIKEYSIKLTNELGKGYTTTRLKYYRRFYQIFSKGPTMSDKLSFSHYCEIVWLPLNKIDYYIKVTNYKAEYLGQILKYVNYIDQNIKKPTHDKTIGLIICKENNEFILKYSTDPKIFNTTYKLI